MREILFRGKTEKGEWVQSGSMIHFNDEGTEKLFYIPKCNEKSVCVHDADDNILSIEEGTFYKVIPETIGQYTGLTDKNGKKIFEGDIVLYTDEDGYYPEEQCEFGGKIVFENGAFGIATNDTIPIDLDFWCDNDNFVSLWELYWNLEAEGEMLSMIEIIGNIHDNPELLEVTE